MKKQLSNFSRRNFIRESNLISAGLLSTPLINLAAESPKNSDSIYIIGPQEGYSPQIGTLLSTMTMMRSWVIGTVKNLTMEQLDFQIDDKSNSIGAMLLHLAATEKYYQLNTFEELEWGTWNDEIKNEWDIPLELGEKGREQIKGNDIDYYLSKLEEIREVTKYELQKEMMIG